MEIEQAKKLKNDLTETLTELLEKFTKETGLKVNDIRLHHLSVGTHNAPDSFLYQIYVEVRV